MNPTDNAWLENRIHAAVDDDFYLDRDEEKRIKEEASARGIQTKDTEVLIRTELDKLGAVCERILLDELDRLLHQFSDNDKFLDKKEERDALDKVLIASPGKKKGLDPRIAEEYVNSFCRATGSRRESTSKSFARPVLAFGLIGLLVIGGIWVMNKNKNPASLEVPKSNTTKSQLPTITENNTSPPPSRPQERIADQNVVLLNNQDKAEIDDSLRRAVQFVEKAQYTDPPEKSAKTKLDSIRQIDPKGQYRGAEVAALGKQIVDHYLALADKSFGTSDMEGVARWIGRAKLMNTNMEIIREKEKAFGLIKTEK